MLVWKVLAQPAQKVKPRIPDDTRIYAIGDVHGRADLLGEMFSAIDDNLRAYPIKQAVQVLLGDYIDRGPNSREVIDALIVAQAAHAMVYLKGNHESYAVQFLSDPSVLSEWKQVGGMQHVTVLWSKAFHPRRPAATAGGRCSFSSSAA